MEDSFDIEEYRNNIKTEKEEWDEFYNGRKLSIDILNNIEIKKRGLGGIKKTYENSILSETVEGPYHDPNSCHLHIWKPLKNIKNFIGEQNKNSEYIQYGDIKNSSYCSICHMRNISFNFKWRPEPDKDVDFNKKRRTAFNDTVGLPKDKVIFYPNIVCKEIEQSPFPYSKKWEKLLKKVFYIIENDKIIYEVSKYKSLLLWPWELTPYQKFKLQNPKYKTSVIFSPNKDSVFEKNYVQIT